VKPRTARIREWISKFPKGIYTTDGKKVIFCQPCGKEAPNDQFCHLKTHNDCPKHQANLERYFLTEKRTNFTEEHLEMYLVCQNMNN